MKRKNENDEFDFGIYEVYYNEEGSLVSCTKEPITPVCSSIEDLEHELSLMCEALKKETLLFLEK